MTYEYECLECGRFEAEQSIKDEALSKCPKCGESIERVITNTAPVIFKGSGWPGKEIKGR
jgi:putative FmdB family regulatory protein